MSNALYGKGREGFARGLIDWVGNTIKAVLVDTGQYTLAIDTHEFLSDIPSGARIAISPGFANKAAPLGVCDSDDVTLPTVTGVSVELVVLYQDTGNAATSRLIAAIDTMTGLPFTPSGGDIVLQWDNGANKIFKL